MALLMEDYCLLMIIGSKSFMKKTKSKKSL
jgi:hypothetical protein